MTHEKLVENAFHWESQYVGQGTYQNYYAIEPKDDKNTVGVFVRTTGSGFSADDPGQMVELPKSFFNSVNEQLQ